MYLADPPTIRRPILSYNLHCIWVWRNHKGLDSSTGRLLPGGLRLSATRCQLAANIVVLQTRITDSAGTNNFVGIHLQQIQPVVSDQNIKWHNDSLPLFFIYFANMMIPCGTGTDQIDLHNHIAIATLHTDIEFSYIADLG